MSRDGFRLSQLGAYGFGFGFGLFGLLAVLWDLRKKTGDALFASGSTLRKSIDEYTVVAGVAFLVVMAACFTGEIVHAVVWWMSRKKQKAEQRQTRHDESVG